mmetsp:Transcript_10382/g.31257  ORF Transcript_10382/g.31257 Transcript_10382/m.31257 type:complete len:534 (-) Transcript_10382:856-2457(-)
MSPPVSQTPPIIAPNQIGGEDTLTSTHTTTSASAADVAATGNLGAPIAGTTAEAAAGSHPIGPVRAHFGVESARNRANADRAASQTGNAGSSSGSTTVAAPAADTPHVITYTEVVLGEDWAGLPDLRSLEVEHNSLSRPRQAASDVATSTADGSPQGAGGSAGNTAEEPGHTGGTSAGGLTGNTHFVVRQPDGAIDVGVDLEKLAELKAAAAAQASAQAAQAQEAAARGDGAQLVVALQGSDYRTFRRRRQIWLILMGVYLLFQIALIPVCITQSAGLSDEGGPGRAWGGSNRSGNWLRDFTFAFSNHEAECVADVVMTLVVTAWSILGAWLLRPCLLAWALAAQVAIAILGAAAVLSPVIILRVAFIAIGIQVRAGILRWHDPVANAQPPFHRHLWTASRDLYHGLAAHCASYCCCMCRRRRAGNVLVEGGAAEALGVSHGSGGGPVDVEAPQQPRLGRSSVSLQLGEQVHAVMPQRRLVWNQGQQALSRDSAISQASTRARVSVDSEGRRSVHMVSLADVGATAAGNPAYR